MRLWQMRPQYEGPVVEALENSYGEFADKSDFAACLLQTAKAVAALRSVCQFHAQRSFHVLLCRYYTACQDSRQMCDFVCPTPTAVRGAPFPSGR